MNYISMEQRYYPINQLVLPVPNHKSSCDYICCFVRFSLVIFIPLIRFLFSVFLYECNDNNFSLYKLKNF